MKDDCMTIFSVELLWGDFGTRPEHGMDVTYALRKSSGTTDDMIQNLISEGGQDE